MRHTHDITAFAFQSVLIDVQVHWTADILPFPEYTGYTIFSCFFYHVDYRARVWQDRGQDTSLFDSEDCPQPQLDERGCQAYLMQLAGKGNVSR